MLEKKRDSVERRRLIERRSEAMFLMIWEKQDVPDAVVENFCELFLPYLWSFENEYKMNQGRFRILFTLSYADALAVVKFRGDESAEQFLRTSKPNDWERLAERGVERRPTLKKIVEYVRLHAPLST